jgi:hypothetical protein
MTKTISRRKFLEKTAAASAVAAVAFIGPRAGASALVLDPSNGAEKKIFPDRWVRISPNLESGKSVEEIRKIAETAAKHGLNGIVLSGMDHLSQASPAYLDHLRQVKAIADSHHQEIIPERFNTGYGGALLNNDKNLAEGLLVKDALFVAKGGTARFVADSPTKLVNGDFEKFQGNRFSGFTAQTEPGEKTFVDTTVFHSGKASLRLENFGQPKKQDHAVTQPPPDVAGLKDTSTPGVARVIQEIRVKPYRCYRVSVWVKTEDAEPVALFGIKSFTPDGRNLSPFNPPAPHPTSGWRQLITGFNSWYADKIELNIGVFEGKGGKVWVDDLRVEEVGLMNVIRRDGAPLTVRDEATGETLQEGRDFAPVSDPDLDFLWNHAMPTIQLLPGGRIHDGARLRVSYYHGQTIYNDQVCACPSAPQVYEYWKKQFPLIEKYLAPKRYFINVDEVRAFNRDESCRRRHLGASAILGDMTQWLYKQIRAVNPKAQVLVWADMFDPHHNARPKYYLVDGSLEDTWKYLPKDMAMVCWWFEERATGLKFFSSRGHKTVAAAYYDVNTLPALRQNVEGWLASLDATPGAQGIMYTTWEKKFQYLAPFGDMVSKR